MNQLIAQAVGDAVVGGLINVLEQQRCVGDPRNQAASGDQRFPSHARATAVSTNPVENQSDRVIARRVLVCSPQVTQPAKPMQLALPGWAGRLQIEGRSITDEGCRPAKPEMAILDLTGKAWIGGAKLLRDDQQLIGNRRPIAPTQQSRAEQSRDCRTTDAVCRQARKTRLLRQCEGRHSDLRSDVTRVPVETFSHPTGLADDIDIAHRHGAGKTRL